MPGATTYSKNNIANTIRRSSNIPTYRAGDTPYGPVRMKVTTLVTKAEWPHSWLVLWHQAGAANEMWLLHNCPPTPNERYLTFLPITST